MIWLVKNMQAWPEWLLITCFIASMIGVAYVGSLFYSMYLSSIRDCE
jgi:hypothetical protein